MGIALYGGGPGQPVDFIGEDADFTPGFATVAGVPYFLSKTADKMGTMAADTDLERGMTAVLIGIGQSSTKMNLKMVIGGAVA